MSLEHEYNQYKMLIEKTIRTLVNQFHRKPYNFFNEHEFHHYCYHTFYRKPAFSKQFKTLNGKKTNILHPEYPTVNRFNRKKIKIDNEKGRRARYDMAILNPEFIKNNKLNTVVNRNIKFTSGKKGDLIAVMEFKFITKHSKKFQHEIDYDFYKLSNAQEAMLKYMLVFSNTTKNAIDYFKLIDKKEGINTIYVTVDEEK